MQNIDLEKKLRNLNTKARQHQLIFSTVARKQNVQVLLCNKQAFGNFLLYSKTFQTAINRLSSILPFKNSLSNLISKITQFFVRFQGFETRGTDISRRLTAWENLLDSVSHVGPLTTNPLEAKGMLSRSKRSAKNPKSAKTKTQRPQSTKSSLPPPKIIPPQQVIHDVFLMAQCGN